MKEAAASLSGSFDLPGGRKVFGTVRLDGKRSHVKLFDDRKFPEVPKAFQYLTGQLYNGDCITLVDCVLQSMSHRRLGEDDVRGTASLFPNTAIIGSHHVPQDVACISAATLFLKDAHCVFYDFDAFSSVIEPEPLVPLLRADKARLRPVDIGEHPIIGYFSGRFEILRVECALGELDVRHRVSESMGGPRGFHLEGQVAVTIKFERLIELRDAMARLHALTRFFELIIGRRQALTRAELACHDRADLHRPLELFEAYAPRARSLGATKDSPGPCDVLLSTVDGVEEFRTVAKNYFASDGDRFDARVRLAGNIRKRNSYTVDRLVAAANMYDILSGSAYPSGVVLSEEAMKAREEAQRIFKMLPDSMERSSVLSVLGRMGEMTLKRKVVARLGASGLSAKFPGIEDVLKEAVNCRNHYVHGSPGKIDYAKHGDVVVFLTNALEFVFGAADLVDCGWSFDRWAARHPQASHPFGAFRLEYGDQFRRFKSLIGIR